KSKKGVSTGPNSLIHNQNISKSLTGKSKSENHKQKIKKTIKNGYDSGKYKKSWKGKSHTEETKQKMKDAWTDERKLKHIEQEHIWKNGNKPNNSGLPHTEETKQKMKDAWTDERLSAHSKNRSGQGNPMFGKNHSDETKKKIGENTKKKKWFNNGLENIYINPDDGIPDNFIRGRIITWKTHKPI